MRVTFIQAGYATWPIGGFKIVYEYANRLAASGHEVTVLHPRRFERAAAWRERAKARLWPLKTKLCVRPLVPWFTVDPRVRPLLVPDLRERFVPCGDAIFATAWQTAEPVASYSRNRGRKLYLIQGHEIWAGNEQQVMSTWRLPLHKVVIARYLRDLAESLGEANRCSYIPNAIDFRAFGIDRPVETRGRTVLMLYHGSVWPMKGTADGIAALVMAKDRVPDLRAVMFSTQERGPDVPAWVEFVRSPSPAELRALYNAAAVFLHPSWSEGWPLPPAEAMACGCALVAASNAGVSDYASADNSLMVPLKDPAALANGLCQLLLHDDLRFRLAHAGNARIREFTWERALRAMKAVLADLSPAGDANAAGVAQTA